MASMVLTCPVPRTHRLTRRATLAGLGLGTLALATGCTLRKTASAADVVRADPLGPLYTETTVLISTYDTAIADRPELIETIGQLRDEHRQHLIALASLIGIAAPTITPGPFASGTSASPSAPPSPAPTRSADDPVVVTRDSLREAEKIAQLNAVSACLDAPTARIAVLASIAACRATHVAALAGTP